MSSLPLLFAQEEVIRWLDGMPWFGWIAIVAIVCGCFTGTINNFLSHRQRMAMIQQGMHPDTPAPTDTVATYKASHPEL